MSAPGQEGLVAYVGDEVEEGQLSEHTPYRQVLYIYRYVYIYAQVGDVYEYIQRKCMTFRARYYAVCRVYTSYTV